MGTWIATHATATAIGGATATAIVAGLLFGLAGAMVAWALYGAGTYGIAAMQKRAAK